jgi:predicted Rossmann fold flavoprotein
MLLKECNEAGVSIETSTRVASAHKGERFILNTTIGEIEAESLVIATGGLSVPKLGASDFGYSVAKQFEVKIVKQKPGLVPLTFRLSDADFFEALSGISLDAHIRIDGANFRENVLFTHRGLSGPAVLQISSYWEEGDIITMNLLPDEDAYEILRRARGSQLSLTSVFDQKLPKRFVQKWFEQRGGSQPIGRYSEKELRDIAAELNAWQIVPSGTEGYNKAEVTVGGIDTDELSSKTMETKKTHGLYFIGEVVDVTGWLGGYNFQWAWSSGWVAGQYV